MSKEKITELDKEDLADYRDLWARRNAGLYYTNTTSFEEATDIEIRYIEFQAYIVKKYLAGENLAEEEWAIDEVTGVIYSWS